MGQNMTRWHRNSPLAARKGWVAPEDANVPHTRKTRFGPTPICCLPVFPTAIGSTMSFTYDSYDAALSCSQQPFGPASGQDKTLVPYLIPFNMMLR